MTRRLSAVEIPKKAVPFVRAINCLPTRLLAISRALGAEALEEVTHVVMAWTQVCERGEGMGTRWE